MSARWIMVVVMGIAAGALVLDDRAGEPTSRMEEPSEACDLLTSTVPRAEAPCPTAWAHVKSARCWEEVEEEGLARLDLKSAEQANLSCESVGVAKQIAMHQASLLRGSPQLALAKLDEVDRLQGGPAADSLLIRAHVAVERGALEEADRYLVEASALQAPEAGRPWQLALARAELSELRGDDGIAESYYRAALEEEARHRSLAARRGPRDGLLSLLARQARWREAMVVVMALDAGDLLRAAAGPALARLEPETENQFDSRSSIDRLVRRGTSTSPVRNEIVSQSQRR